MQVPINNLACLHSEKYWMNSKTERAGTSNWPGARPKKIQTSEVCLLCHQHRWSEVLFASFRASPPLLFVDAFLGLTIIGGTIVELLFPRLGLLEFLNCRMRVRCLIPELL